MKHRYATAALANVAQSQARLRTNRQPSARSRTTDTEPDCMGAAGTRISSSMAAEKRNVALSSANTRPAPPAATRMPPSAGPAIRRTRGRMSWSSALACASRSAGTMSGTKASNAGAKKAAPVPYRAARTATCQTSRTPASARPARTAPASARRRSAATISVRREKRSLATPPMSKNMIVGTVIAIPTSAIAVGELDSS